jgi:hypothetical protein
VVTKAQEIVLESMQTHLRHVKKYPIQYHTLSSHLNPSVQPNREQRNIQDEYDAFIDGVNEREVAACERRIERYEDAIAGRL